MILENIFVLQPATEKFPIVEAPSRSHGYTRYLLVKVEGKKQVQPEKEGAH